MKLIISIPCYNEEQTLPLVLQELPKHIDGIDEIEVQVIDDGSSDRTAEIALEAGCHVVRHTQNRGLGVAFQTAANSALERNADIMVNTDADNQYPSRYITELVQPILKGDADIVIGNRRPWAVEYFNTYKRFLQFVGNGITRQLAGSNVPDTISGFRAYSREGLFKLNVFTSYSYTLVTIVQASKKGLKIASIPIETNPPTRSSRLFKNMFDHIRKSASNIIIAYVIYEPLRTFFAGSLVFLLPATILLGRYFFFLLQGDSGGHIQSLVISAIGFNLAGILFVLGIIAGLIAHNRRLMEEILYFDKKQLYDRLRNKL